MDCTLWRDDSGRMFFSAYCEQAGRKVLLGPDNFVDLVHGPDGFELHYRCHCGRSGVFYPKHPASSTECAA